MSALNCVFIHVFIIQWQVSIIIYILSGELNLKAAAGSWWPWTGIGENMVMSAVHICMYDT